MDWKTTSRGLVSTNSEAEGPGAAAPFALAAALVPPSLFGAIVWFAAGHGYLIAHTLAELFSVVVAFSALAVATTSRRFTRNHFVIVIAVAIGWCAGIDLIHTLVFKGMHLVPSDSTNLPAQLWVAARAIQAVAMVVAPLMLSRAVGVGRLHLLFGGASMVAVAAIFSGNFPDAFVEGRGLTPFKVNAEYVIIGLLAASLLLLWQRRRLAAPRLVAGIAASTVAMMATEFAFTQYASAYAPSNLLGHVLKIYAYWFIYVALVRTTLEQPFSMLARAASTYDAVPDPTLVVSADGTILQANAAAARLAGVAAQDLVGRSSHLHFHDPSTPASVCPVCSRLGTTDAQQVTLLPLPGYRHVECSVAPYAQGMKAGERVQVVRDVTERQASEELFRRLFEDTRQAITLVEDGRFVAANRATLEMLGMERSAQLVGLTPVDVSPEFQPDGRRSAEKAAEVIAVAFAQGAHEFEWEHVRNGGEHFIARVLLVPIRRAGKDVLHVSWTDITRQKIAEREVEEARQALERRVAERTAELARATRSLDRSRARLEAIFQGASAGILLIRDGSIEKCNRRLETLTGHGPGELAGRPVRAIFSDPLAWDAALPELSARLARGETHSGEMLVQRRGGADFWVRFSASAVEAGAPDAGIVGMLEDITVERAAMEEMARARALAEDAARTKSRFLANMSHEIRTPMNSIMGMTHLALRADPSPKVRDHLEKIQSSSKHLLGVINDILDYSKLEADRVVLERVEFQLEQVFDSVVALFSEKARAKGLELVLSMASDVPPRVTGDPLRLEQILINLVGNAVKFTDRGEVAVGIVVDRHEGDDVRLRFSVRDTGIGMSQAQCEGLFQSFQQADSSITRRFGGSGLGLAIAKRLAELMQGEIGVESTPGAGSTFWFTARLGVAAGMHGHYVMHPDLHGLRTLVVDDNDAARQVIAEMLRGLSFRVTEAASGRGALGEIGDADADGRAYDLVILDWRMPGMDGLEVARAIHGMPLRHRPNVLMVTAFDRDEVQPSAAQLGVREVLVKPVTPSILFNAVMRQFEQAPEAQRPAAHPAEDALAPRAALAGVRALLVEDNVLNQEVASEFLKALGLEVDVAEDGAVALERVRRGTYDVVLMDMQMPVMDGLVATREIRKLPGRADLPILAMTANAMQGDRERCIEAGMNDHIAKPIEPVELADKLSRWVRGASGSVDAQAGD